MNAVRKTQRRRLWRFLLRILLVLTGIGLLFAASVYMGLWGPVPTEKELATLELDRASEVYSSDSVLIGKFFRFDRQPIPLKEIPDHLIEALIAVEDARFRQHRGIDFPSLGRVLIKSILMGDEAAGGGSTLSQQLIKNLYPRTGTGTVGLAADKLREMIAARRLEQVYSKDQILELYLNTVSFGGNRYGIEAAARTFFNTTTARLEPHQGATLVGMLKATYSYDPHRFPERSRERRNLVLELMAKSGVLTTDEANRLKNQDLGLDYRPFRHDAGLAPYFRERVRKTMARWLEAESDPDSPLDLYTSGLKIYTTLDSRMQHYAETAMQEHLKALQKRFREGYGKAAPWRKGSAVSLQLVRESAPYLNLKKQGLSDSQALDSLEKPGEVFLWDWDGGRTVNGSAMDSILHYAQLLQAGSLAINPSDGAVRVWVGGINYEHYKFDHVAQSRRQVGSTFKPVVYASALEDGMDPCRYHAVREIRYENYEGWTPSNSGEKAEAYMNYSMQTALQQSVNTIAVKILEETGIEKVIETARAMGIRDELPQQPSLALGSGEVGMEQLAGAYACFLNSGRPVTPYLITSVTDRDGRERYKHQNPEPYPPAFSEQTRELMLQMLESVADKGTAASLRTQYGLKGDLAGKTGTTQNNKDAWFVALTPKLVHVSWVGLDNHRIGFPSTRIGQGAQAALPLFARWYKSVQQDRELRALTQARFPEPDPGTLSLLDCPAERRDGFFKRLFTNPNKTKTRNFRDKSNP